MRLQRRDRLACLARPGAKYPTLLARERLCRDAGGFRIALFELQVQLEEGAVGDRLELSSIRAANRGD